MADLFSCGVEYHIFIFHSQLQQASIVSMLPNSPDNSQVSIYCKACTFVIPYNIEYCTIHGEML